MDKKNLDAYLIQEILTNLNISQKELSQELGITASSITAIKKGSTPLNLRIKELLSTKFNISKKWLESGEGDMISEETINFNYIKRIIDIISEDGKKSKLIKSIIDVSDNEVDDIVIISKNSFINK